MDTSLKQFINPHYTYAVIGASSHVQKYGYKVFKDLHDAGFRVLPVHPDGGVLLGEHVYKNIQDIPLQIDVVIFVVPPAVSLRVLPAVVASGIENVWFQPGSADKATEIFCHKQHLHYSVERCIMMERLKIV